jgi:hypothetical protein
VQGLDVGAQDSSGGARVEVYFGGDLTGDPCDAVEGEVGEVVALAGEGDQKILLAGLAVGAAARLLGCGGRADRDGLKRCSRCGWRGAAGGDGAFFDDPAAEPAQRAEGGER